VERHACLNSPWTRSIPIFSAWNSPLRKYWPPPITLANFKTPYLFTFLFSMGVLAEVTLGSYPINSFSPINASSHWVERRFAFLYSSRFVCWYKVYKFRFSFKVDSKAKLSTEKIDRRTGLLNPNNSPNITFFKPYGRQKTIQKNWRLGHLFFSTLPLDSPFTKFHTDAAPVIYTFIHFHSSSLRTQKPTSPFFYFSSPGFNLLDPKFPKKNRGIRTPLFSF